MFAKSVNKKMSVMVHRVLVSRSGPGQKSCLVVVVEFPLKCALWTSVIVTIQFYCQLSRRKSL
jgi:hypothetical protein